MLTGTFKRKAAKLKLRSQSGAHAQVAMEVMIVVQSGTPLRALRVLVKRSLQYPRARNSYDTDVAAYTY